MNRNTPTRREAEMKQNTLGSGSRGIDLQTPTDANYIPDALISLITDLCQRITAIEDRVNHVFVLAYGSHLVAEEEEGEPGVSMGNVNDMKYLITRTSIRLDNVEYFITRMQKEINND